jgi:hypothetical protein
MPRSICRSAMILAQAGGGGKPRPVSALVGRGSVLAAKTRRSIFAMKSYGGTP